jgi:phosphatidylethanolamine-binding protein (PEBP) family uncharacterized protein
MHKLMTTLRRPAWQTGIFIGALSLAGAAHALDLRSTTFTDHGTLSAAQMYRGFGCEGGNVSPQLIWSDPPAGTKSFAIPTRPRAAAGGIG